MKTLLIALFTAASAFAQTTFSLTIPGDPGSVSITLSAQAIPSMIAGIENSPAPGVSPSTLTSAALSTDTTLTVASTTGAAPGMGVCFGTAPTCTEVCFIGTVPSGTSLTVTRHLFGTTAAAYAINTPFTYIQYGSAGEWIAGQIRSSVLQYMTAFPGPTIATANAAIATQSATITSTVAAGFSKTP